MVPLPNQGHRTTIGKHYPTRHEVLTRFGDKQIWKKPIFSKL